VHAHEHDHEHEPEAGIATNGHVNVYMVVRYANVNVTVVLSVNDSHHDPGISVR